MPINPYRLQARRTIDGLFRVSSFSTKSRICLIFFMDPSRRLAASSMPDVCAIGGGARVRHESMRQRIHPGNFIIPVPQLTAPLKISPQRWGGLNILICLYWCKLVFNSKDARSLRWCLPACLPVVKFFLAAVVVLVFGAADIDGNFYSLDGALFG